MAWASRTNIDSYDPATDEMQTVEEQQNIKYLASVEERLSIAIRTDKASPTPIGTVSVAITIDGER